MPTGYESVAVNGQLVNVAPATAYDPLIFGQQYATTGAWPRQGVYTAPPVLPSPELQAAMAPASYGGSSAGNPVMPTAMGENGNPFHLTKSPVLWAIGFLVFAVAMLHFVHYKG